MASHRLYYALKPYFPARLRRGVRSVLAKKKRVAYREVWPINYSAAQPPVGWTGWPGEQKFAVVLTHDVEGQTGLDKHARLAAVELELGFRSSFNFVPEGDYKVSPEQRHYLASHGFEVGVHDLHHNGKLFGSAKDFSAKAVKINQYLQAWGASGFRSGFMLRNLDWIHQLQISYDASTFDTDPFEPQPDGVGTIFPFWRRRTMAGEPGKQIPAETAGYVELPYTLPQDSTLFLVLREPSPTIWLQKADWLAAKGGMILVNVHPDYIQFEDEPVSSRTFPVSHYRQLLQHLKSRYAGQYWQPLPRELAAWYASSAPALQVRAGSELLPAVRDGREKPLGGRRAAVLLYSVYPADPRPRRAAEALAQAGMEVDLLCLSETENDLREEVISGVRVFRAPMQRQRGSKKDYIFQYTRFIISSFLFLLRRGVLRKYDVVHVHNMPDVLVFSAVVAKLRGAKVILDLHDPMPELMITIYGLKPQQAAVRALKWMEKCSTRLANVVITVNLACKNIFAKRSCGMGKLAVIMNSPEESIFKFQKVESSDAKARDRPFVIMYHGSIVERHGLDLAVQALAIVRRKIPQAVLWIYGVETAFLRTVLSSVKGTPIEGAVSYFGPRNLEGIAEAIGLSDVGVIPNRRSIFTELNTPTRIFEYLSQGKPIIAPRAAGILDYFGPDELVYFDLGSAEDLADRIVYVYENPEEVRQIVERGQKIYQDHMWSTEKHRFLAIVQSLLGVQASASRT